VKDRRRARAKIGSNHRITPDETMMFVKDMFGVEIT
jgi:hypothetical protein